MCYTAAEPAPDSTATQRFCWSWAWEDLNLRLHPDPKIHGEQARGNIRGGAGSDQGGALVAR
jgi:hypothetical protein